MKFIPLLLFLAIGIHADSRPMLPTGPTPMEELALEEQNKANFKLFKTAVLPTLVNPIMRKDIYLVKFFKSAGMDVEVAKGKLEVALQIRKENNIDKIMKLDFRGKDGGITKLEASTKQVDNKGRPVLYLRPGGWPLKTALALGDGPKYESTLYRLMEGAVISAIFSKMATGTDVSQLDVIINFDTWTDDEGGASCLECAPFITKIAGNIAKTWPSWINKIALVNISPEASAFVDRIKLVLPTSLQAEVYTYGKEMVEWWPKVVSLIPEEALKKLFKS